MATVSGSSPTTVTLVGAGLFLVTVVTPDAGSAFSVMVVDRRAELPNAAGPSRGEG